MSEGLRFVLANPYLRAFAAEAAMFNLFFHAMMTAFFVTAVRDLGMATGVFGFLLATAAIGTLIGSLAAKRVLRRVAIGRAILWTMFLGTWPFLLVPVAARPGGAAFAALVVAHVCSGVGIGIVVVLVATLRQTVTPERMMGRMNASYRFIVWGVIALGSALGGVLSSAIGPHATITVGAIGIAASPVWIVCSPVGRLRDAHEAILASGPASTPMATTQLTGTRPKRIPVSCTVSGRRDECRRVVGPAWRGPALNLSLGHRRPPRQSSQQADGGRVEMPDPLVG